MPDIGKVIRVPIRDVFKSEPRDFTPWLASNLDELGDFLGFKMTTGDTEVEVGRFAADIVAVETSTGSTVVIENQLTESDHDHLGKCLTYAAGLGASIVVWIAPEFRDEHISAMEWLNENTLSEVDFICVSIAMGKIGDSFPAPLFTSVVRPREMAVGSTAAVTVNESAYKEYWSGTLAKVAKEVGAHQAKPSTRSWVAFGSGTTGPNYVLAFRRAPRRASVELYLDGEKEWNTAIFESLQLNKDEIEKAVGDELSWELMEDQKACKIAMYRPGHINDSEQIRSQISDWMVDSYKTFKVAVAQFLEKAVKDNPPPTAAELLEPDDE